MGTKGTKASNIYQVLKGAGAWQSKDSQGPMIKGVGVKSPLNMKASPAKIMPSPSVEKKIDKKEEPVKKTSYSEAYKKRDMKTYGNLSEAEYTAEAKRQNKSKKETGKWDAPKKQMESKDNPKKEEPKVEDPKVEETTTPDKPVKSTDVTVKSRKQLRNERRVKRLSNKAKNKGSLTKGQQKRLAIAEEKAAGKSGKDARDAAKKKLAPKEEGDTPAKMKSSPAKKYGHKSPAKKALVGKQNNLPEDLKAKIKASPAKKYKK